MPFDPTRFAQLTETPSPTTTAAAGFDPRKFEQITAAPSPRASGSPLVGAAQAVGKALSPLGRALDAQRWAVAKKLTGETDPDKQRAVYRSKVPGLAGIYEGAGKLGPLGHVAQGLVDIGVDTATDPLTYETWGAGPVAEGVGRVGKALSPLAKAALKRAPEAVQTAVKDAGQIGKAAREGITRITAPGGKEAGELENARGRGARDILLGASGKHALNEEEMKRAFLARFDKTVKDLASEEETNVYKALNGERGAQGLNPKEAEAFSGLRKLADEAAYSEANPGLRWAISLRQGGLRDGARGRTFHAKAPELEPLDPALVPEQQKIIAEDKTVRGAANPRLSRALYPLGREVKQQPKGSGLPEWAKSKAGVTPEKPSGETYELTRQQSTVGPAEFSEARGGTYYSTGGNIFDPENAPVAWLTRGKLGGEHEVKETAAFQNPLKLSSGGMLPVRAIQAMRGDDFVKRVIQANAEASEGHDKPLIDILREIGASEESATHTLKDLSGGNPIPVTELEHILNQGSRERLDRIAATLAQQAGHDAIIGTPDTSGAREVFAFHNAPKPKESGAEDELDAFLNENAPVRPASGQFSNPLEDETFGRPPRRLWRNVRRADVQPLDVSPDIAEFVGPGGRRDAYRWRYLPGYREGLGETESREAFEVNPLNWENPNLKEREEFRVDPEKHPEQREAFRRMLGNAARESATASLQRELPERGLPIGPLVESALQRRVRAKGAERTGGAKLEDAYKGLLRYGRAAQVGLTPFHAANIMALQAAHAPTTIPEAIGTTARALLPGANRHELFREGRELGALAPSMERQPLWAKTPLAARAALGAGTGGTAGFAEGDKNTPLPERLEHAGLGALAGAAAAGLVPAWSKGMSNLVFTYDDAAKQALAQNYARRGITRPYQAGRQAAEDLVDYANPSSLGNALSFVSKFPTYRSQLPFAALRGIARNPARFEALNRATQGVLSGGTAQTPVGPVKSYASTADVGRGVGDVAGYARSTFADPVKIGISLAEKFRAIPKQQWGYYFTYKLDPTDKRVLLSAAAAGLPEARSILDEVGLGEFKQNPGSSKLPIPVREGLFDVSGLSVGR